MFPKRQALPKRIAMTDALRGIDPLKQLAILNAGDVLIFRHYELGKRERLSLGLTLRNACKHARVLFLVAGDKQLGATLRADGLHLPSWALRQGYSWHQRTQPNWLISSAAHSIDELLLAERLGVDMAIASPVFPTQSHRSAKPLGTLGLASLRRQTSIPTYALGGMNEASNRLLQGTGVTGYAFVSVD